MLAYYETVRSGLVPVKVIEIKHSEDGRVTSVVGRVTGRTNRTYRCGEIVEAGAGGLHMIPRDKVRKFRSSPFPKVLSFSWQGVTL